MGRAAAGIAELARRRHRALLRLEPLARRWQERDRPDDLLWVGSAYREYQLWRERYPGGLSGDERRFVAAMERLEFLAEGALELMAVLEDRLADRQWLMGNDLSEPDIRLFPTLARFDVAYHYAFKCNIRRLVDYPALWRYARRIYAMPGVAGTVDFEIYKQGYFSPSELRNPLGIVPAGPVVDWSL